MHQIKQICLYRYVISFARFEEDKCLNSYEIVAKLAKIFKHCLAPCKVIQILQFRKFFFVKSCILEISSRGMRGAGASVHRLHMESAILPTIRIRNPVHPESTTWNTDSNNVLSYLQGVTCFASELVRLLSQ